MSSNMLEKKDLLNIYVREYLFLYYNLKLSAEDIQMVNEKLFKAVKDKYMIFELNITVHLDNDYQIEKVVFDRQTSLSFSDTKIYRDINPRSREAYINCYLRLVLGTSLNYLVPGIEKGLCTCITVDFRRIVLDISEGKIRIVSHSAPSTFVTEFNRSYNY